MELDRADLFLITLDEERGWFRYHHLFQELLQHNLVGHEDQATVTTLHRRAAAWLAEAGRVDDAVEHWLAADAVDEAAALVEAKVQQLLIRAPHEARQLITRLPEAVLGRYPRLILDRCFLAILFDDRQMHVYAEEAKETLRVQENAGALTPAMQGEWLVLQGSVAFRKGDLNAALNFVESAEVCLDSLPNYIGGILSFLSMHLRHRNDQPTALAQGDRAISAFERAGLIAGAVAVRRELARWAMLAGDRQAATERFQAIYTGHLLHIYRTSI